MITTINGPDLLARGATVLVEWELAEAQRKILELETRLAASHAHLQLAAAAADQTTKYLETIAVALREEAEQREWCDEYENFVNSLSVPESIADVFRRFRTYEVRFRCATAHIDHLEAAIDEWLSDNDESPCSDFKAAED